MSHFSHILFFSSCSLQTDSEIPPLLTMQCFYFRVNAKKETSRWRCYHETSMAHNLSSLQLIKQIRAELMLKNFERPNKYIREQ